MNNLAIGIIEEDISKIFSLSGVLAKDRHI
jgi:hypothetical protein